MSVVFMVSVLLAVTVLTALTQFASISDYVAYVRKVLQGALTFPYMFFSPLVLLGMIVLVNNVEQKYPRLNVGITDLWRKSDKEKQNAFVRLTRHKYLGIPYTALLIVTTPVLASYEEFIFRDQALASELPGLSFLVGWMPELVFILLWSVFVFGIIHVFSGVNIGEAIVLGFGGLYFAVVFRYFGGVSAAIVAHTSYNIWAIAFMSSPRAKRFVSNALVRAGNALQTTND
jgi:membrane protease YdiL (CAAX protease family)